MAHFAKVKDGKVIKVIVADQDYIDSLVENEPGQWIKTSYNTIRGTHYERNDDGTLGEPSADQTKALRKNYAGVGFSYDGIRDAFIPPKPYRSWVLDEDTCIWEPPVARPTEAGAYEWNESTQSWDSVTESEEPII